MKKFICALTLLIGFNANAGLITIQLSDSEVKVGESVQVSLLAREFDPFDAFDFDFDFDTSLFSYDVSSLTSDLLLVPPFDFAVNEEPEGMALSYLDFIPFPGGDFLLASFDLLAISHGSSTFSLSDELFFDSATTPPRISVDIDSRAQANAVVEPSTLMLTSLAGLALFGFRRKA